ncbi:hypothetical protein [Pandoraea sp.]|uniref:hypothetical protein n=1 Tax=Pandoraea sp. TaxID=1883445 RepID=UPI001213A0BB|nr:hypothetical protein [Pandoraea sp.]TAL52654.1 MAG: hypothetical protein EPN80_18370 [Pandoraea sp.]TAM16343.1 MAG: hypothetical protein EPN65_15080 [Pandoraea sp.]
MKFPTPPTAGAVNDAPPARLPNVSRPLITIRSAARLGALQRPAPSLATHRSATHQESSWR